MFVTSGFDGEERPGDDGRVAPPLATARAAAVSAAEPVLTGLVGSLASAGAEGLEPDADDGEDVDDAGFAPEAVTGLDGEPEVDGFELTLGEASVVIGDAPPPGLGRDVVPGR